MERMVAMLPRSMASAMCWSQHLRFDRAVVETAHGQRVERAVHDRSCGANTAEPSVGNQRHHQVRQALAGDRARRNETGASASQREPSEKWYGEPSE